MGFSILRFVRPSKQFVPSGYLFECFFLCVALEGFCFLICQDVSKPSNIWIKFVLNIHAVIMVCLLFCIASIPCNLQFCEFGHLLIHFVIGYRIVVASDIDN